MEKKIAIIDDDPASIELLQDILTKIGYNTVTAMDGISGYELVEQEHPNLILLDILLPRLNGVELCKKIKANKELRNIPIIAITAVYKKSKYKQEMIKLGADAYIYKPLSINALLFKIEELLNKKSI